VPWTLHKSGARWCVHKKGSSSPVPGGCHGTRAEAIKHMRGLYRNVPDAAASEGSETMSGLVAGALSEDEITQGANALWYFTGPKAEFKPNDSEERGLPFRGPIAVEGHPTSDRRLLIAGEIDERAMPVPLNVQIQTSEEHKHSFNAGRIETIEHVPFSELDDELKEEFGLEGLAENTVVIWATGTFDTSEYADEAQRMLANGAGVSIDMSKERAALVDPETLQEIEDASELSIEEQLFGEYLNGYAGKIGGATIVTMAAFEEASIKVLDDRVLVASAFGLQVWKPFALVASAGPVKPSREWFQNPQLKELTPWTVTKEGRVFGHLADWDGCHIGFQGICVPPFRSSYNYEYFNNQELETAEGDLVPVGKIMFSRAGVGHAPTDPNMSWQEVQRYYDDATCVGAFVTAGADRFGTWIAGALRSDLTDLEVQHMRTHGPSGDWRPIHPTDMQGELIAALAVPIQGFQIPRKALVASANGQITAVITAPLTLTEEDGHRRRRRAKVMLGMRLREALGIKQRTRAEMRAEALSHERGEADGR
jgi:hypothetical protein